MEYYRPKINLTKTTTDIVLERLALAALLLLWISTIMAYRKLPEIIPTHYDLSGKIDDYGSKMTVFLMPAIATFVFILLTVINRFPHRFNYLGNVTDDNAEKLYSQATRLMRYINLVVMLAMLFISSKITNIKAPQGANLEWWFIPMLMLLLLAPTIYTIYRSFKK